MLFGVDHRKYDAAAEFTRNKVDRQNSPPFSNASLSSLSSFSSRLPNYSRPVYHPSLPSYFYLVKLQKLGLTSFPKNDEFLFFFNFFLFFFDFPSNAVSYSRPKKIAVKLDLVVYFPKRRLSLKEAEKQRCSFIPIHPESCPHRFGLARPVAWPQQHT